MKIFKFVFLIIGALILIGCSNTVEIKFVGMNEEIISIQKLEKGSIIVYPQEPIIEGYEFIGWSAYYEVAKEDMTIKANYEPFLFNVIFYDYDNNILDEQIVEYGKDAIVPDLPHKDNVIFISWDQDTTNVTNSLIVKPVYEKEYYEVVFKDIYDNILSTQKVKNGEDAVEPEIPNIKYYNFKQWDQEFMNIKQDLIIKPVYEKIEYNYSKEDVNYWLQLLSLKYDITKELMSIDDINKYNQLIISATSETKVVDLLNLDQNISISKLVNSYNHINNNKVYNFQTNELLSQDEIDYILYNKSKNLSEENEIQYGIVTNFTLMRSYPTMHYQKNYDRDLFQETSLNVGEGVVIYTKSADEEWYFVQAQNYYGWVLKENIALCTFDEMKSFLNPTEKVVVISDYVIIENAHVRMGQYFPLLKELENAYSINFPTRNNAGQLVLKELMLAKSEHYNKGFLKYNYENLFKQSFKLLGNNYSWGDKDIYGRDCTSTQMGIYKCFGFNLPRNTGNQIKVPNYASSCYGATDKYMQTKHMPGTLIYSSGHVMMYIGEDVNGKTYLFHNTSADEGKCILQPLSEYGGSKIIAFLKLMNY